MDDAHDPYGHEADAMEENIWVGNAETKFNGRRYQETPPDIASTMRSLIKSHEEQNQLNASMLQSLKDIQRWMNSGHRAVNPEGSKSSSRRRLRSSSGSSDFEGSTRVSISSSHRDKRKRRCQKCSRDEFKKARPPTFNGEVNTGQEAEAWLLGMKKYALDN